MMFHFCIKVITHEAESTPENSQEFAEADLIHNFSKDDDQTTNIQNGEKKIASFSQENAFRLVVLRLFFRYVCFFDPEGDNQRRHGCGYLTCTTRSFPGPAWTTYGERAKVVKPSVSTHPTSFFAKFCFRGIVKFWLEMNHSSNFWMNKNSIKLTIQKTTKTPKVRWSSWPQFQPEYLHVRARIEGMDISEVAGTVAARMGSVNEVRLI